MFNRPHGSSANKVRSHRVPNAHRLNYKTIAKVTTNKLFLLIIKGKTYTTKYRSNMKNIYPVHMSR